MLYSQLHTASLSPPPLPEQASVLSIATFCEKGPHRLCSLDTRSLTHLEEKEWWNDFMISPPLLQF